MSMHSTDPIYFANPEDLIACYESGTSIKQIAEELGMSRPLITRFFKKHNVALRDPKAANQLMMTSRTTAENRHNVAAAHRARRGDKDTLDVRCRRAKTRQERVTHQSPYEVELWRALVDSEIRVTPQAAVGPYSVDLLIEDRLAVEVCGGDWHSATNFPIRSRYIYNHGLDRLTISVVRRHLFEPKDCVAYIQTMLRFRLENPDAALEHHLIWSDGKFHAMAD